MPILHKILQGDGAHVYLPYALSRLRALERTYGPHRWFAQKYRLPGFEIDVWQEPPLQFLRIKAEAGIYFEFLTNGKPVESMTLPGHTIPAYRTAAVGVTISDQGAVRSRFVRGKVDAGQSPSLVRRMPQVQLVDEPAFACSADTTLYESWAPNHPFTGILQRSFFNSNDWGEYSGTASKNRGYGRGMHSAFSARDINLDVPFQMGRGSSNVGAFYVDDDDHEDWPRASALQRVTHQTYGSRLFGISVDASSQFYVFPIAALERIEGSAIEQRINPDYLRKFTPKLPAWVFLTGGQRLKDIVNESGVDNSFTMAPDVDWKFSRDGKKACLVAIERQKAEHDATFVRPAPNNRLFRQDFYDGLPTGLGYDATNALGEKQRFHSLLDDTRPADEWFNYAPGLVEVTVRIALTGDRLQDFRIETEETDVRVVRRPTETPYCTLLAGYCWYDIKAPDWTAGNQHYLAREGDLCVLDVERWWNPTLTSGYLTDYEQETTPPLPDDSPLYGRRAILMRVNDDDELRRVKYPDAEASKPYISFMTLKNLTRETELICFNSAAVIDYDFPTLSFAMLERYDEWSLGEYNTWGSGEWELYFGISPPKAAGGTPYPIPSRQFVRHFGVSIFTQATFREVIFPDSTPESAQVEILSSVTVSPRDTLAELTPGYELVPLNEPRDWTDTELAKLRFNSNGFKFNYRYQGPWGSATQYYGPSDDAQQCGMFFAHRYLPRVGESVYSWTYASMPVMAKVLYYGGADTHDDWWSKDADIPLPGFYWTVPYVYYTPMEARDWFVNALWTASGPPIFSFYITPPRFGWIAYTDEILARIQIAPSSTFFAHPNGSWAFYSPQFIYNRNPMVIDGVNDPVRWNDPSAPAHLAMRQHMPPSNREALVKPFVDLRVFTGLFDFGVPAQIDTLTPFDTQKLEHCIFDRVHLVPNRGGPVETTFRALYNQASEAAEDDKLKPITLEFLQATFTKQTIDHVSWANRTSDPYAHPFEVPFTFQVLDLNVSWQGNLYHYKEIGYFTTAEAAGGPDNINVHGIDYGGHGLVDLTMGQIFTTAAGDDGDWVMPDIAGGYTTFSSCLMIAPWRE